MTTPDIIITVFGALLTVGLGIIIYNNRIATAERKDDRERLIRIETRLEGLDSMREEIQRNRHKIADVDKIIVDIRARLLANEKSLDSVNSFCSSQHKSFPK